VDDLGLRSNSRLEHAGGFVHTAQGAKEIEHVEGQDDIGMGQDVSARISGIEAVRIGKIKPTTAIDNGHS
jgi:hypothetical protein